MPIVKSLEVIKFRSVPKEVIPIAKNITILSGRNATCKTTILGLIMHPFGSRKAAQKPPNNIWGKQMVAKFGESFKLSTKHDSPGEHEYILHLYQNTAHGKDVKIKSYPRKNNTTPDTDEDDDIVLSTPSKSLRFVVGETRTSGQGHINFPVMYLSLKRLYPIGETTKFQVNQTDFTEDEKLWFKESYMKIMAETAEIEFAVTKSAKEKESLGVNTESYDSLLNSAGQDNVTRIIGSVLSFKRLKSTPNSNYKGGILAIDEIEASLHPAAQRSIFDFLYMSSQQYDIQIIVTSHSLDFISKAYARITQTKNPTKIKVLYFNRNLKTPDKKVVFLENPSIDYIQKDINLYLNPSRSPASSKVNIYVEDAEAKWLLAGILPTALKQRITIINTQLDHGKLRNLLSVYSQRIVELNNIFIILDGDQPINVPNSRALSLPGGNSPERVIFHFLDAKRTCPENDFWINPQGYTSEHFSNTRPTTEEVDNRETIKTWFNSEISLGSWGKNGSWILKKFKEEYADDISTFSIRLKEKLNLHFTERKQDIIK